MRNFLLLVIFSVLGATMLYENVQAQTCNGIVSNGRNLVTNGSFSQGYAGWTHDAQYVEYTPCSNCWSVPGRIFVGADEKAFNQAFTTMPDHSPSADDNSLMVDGVCDLGINLWSQPGIPIEPNTNYFFSVWITSLYSNTPRGTLRFDINGSPLAQTITHSGAVGVWEKVTGVWNSGLTPPATVTISIQNTNTTGCNDAVDFAIDDISFTPGCEFGSPGPTPELGADFSICGKTLPLILNPNFDAATSARMDIRYRWFKDGVLMVEDFGPSFYNFSVNSAGTYSVCVDSAGNCPKTDVIVITSDYTVDLGPSQILCSPVAGSLDAGHTGPGVTYTWFKDGTQIGGETTRFLNPTTPGNYSVTVTDPACGAESSTVNITTQTAIPVDAEFCATVNNGSATLQVIGTGKYKWFDAPINGNVVATGLSYTADFTSPGPHTFYVEDTSSFAGNIGPKASGPSFVFTGPQSVSDNIGGSLKQRSALFFNAEIDFKLDSVLVRPYIYDCNNPPTINIGVFDDAGNHLPGSPVYYAIPAGQCVVGQPSSSLIKVPLNISIPQGTGYHIRLVPNASNQESMQITYYLNGAASGSTPNPSLNPYPQTHSINGVETVTFTGNDPQSFNLYFHPEAFPGFFDWKITRGTPCDRVQVTAREDCGVPPTCIVTAPTGATVEGGSTSYTYCNNGLQTDLSLEVVGGSGERLVWYKESCGVTANEVGRNNDGTPITIPAPTVSTTYFARWESDADGGCVSACESVPVTVVEPPSPSVPGADQPLCNEDSTVIEAVAPLVGTGIWTSPTLTFAVPADRRQTLKNIPVGTHTLTWTVSNGGGVCSPSINSLTITRDVLATPIIALTEETLDTCANVTDLNFSTTVDNAPNGSSYTWSSTGTLNITSSSGNSATVDVGASGGVLTITEVKGVCSLDTFVTIDVVPDISTPDAGANQLSCINSVQLMASPLSAGSSGMWTVVNGTGIFSDATDRLTDVTGLSNGVNTFRWTVTGCGGPLSDDVEVNVSPSGMVLDAFGPSDTLCVEVERGLRASVAGGSGNYQYYWVSSDSSFKLSTPSTSVTVKPKNTLVTYYVIAYDMSSNGCISNLDSVKVNSLFKQNLKFNNLLTPNEDGFNDKLVIRDGATLHGILPGATLEIYNNWGGKVYFSQNYDNGWKANGLADGVYFYHVKTGCGGEIYKGWIQIISNTNQ